MGTSKPIRPEGVAAEYVGRWTICRDVYPDWEAASCLPGVNGKRKKVTANGALAEQLAKTRA